MSTLFECAWAQLKKSYRNEYVYKNEIASRIGFGRHRPHTASLYVEMPVGRSIVDVAVFNGTSTAYEIKTEYDTARRLGTQTRDYLKAFAEVYLVTHPDFVAGYASVIEDEVGIIALLRDGSLRRIRPAAPNTRRLEHKMLVRCLRTSECISAIGEEFPEVVGLPNGLVGQACQDAFAKINIDRAHKIYVDALRARKIQLRTSDFLTNLPMSLRALGCASPLSERQQVAVAERLQMLIPVSLA